MESTKFFKNDPPEVLVLPPNILEKLGINLGNIQSYTNGAETKSDAEALAEETNTSNLDGPDVLSNNYDNVCDEESSILETANLMKASVFLSPTFTNLKPNNDLQQKKIETATCEFNVSREINNTETIGMMGKPVQFIDNNDNDSQEVKNNNCDMLPNLSNKINITSEEIICSEKIKELITFEILDNSNLVPVPISTIINKHTSLMNSKVSIKSFKENNKIQCNDDNIENTVNILPSYGFTTEEKKNPTMKLQNQSHKTIIFNKLKDDDVPQILKEVNIEIQIEIGDNDNSNNNGGDNIPLEEDAGLKLNGLVWKGTNELNEKTLDFVEINCNNSNHEDEHFINVENENIYDIELNKEKSITVIDSRCKCAAVDFEDEFTGNILPKKDSEHCNEKLNSDIITQSDDVVLFQVSSFDNTNLDAEQEVAIKDLSHIENREICNNNKVINVNKNKVKSKLCIQGVEKPGGESENEHKGIYVNDLKTYSRGKRTKFSKAVFFENQDCFKSNLNIDVDINCKNNNYSIKDIKTQKFCICEDFGYFSYYDKDIDYRHIHYWEQKGAECSLDMLLSIYEDNKVIEINVPEIDNNEKNIVVEVQNESNHNVYNICWMNLDSNLKNTKDIIESSEEINQERNQAEIMVTSDVIVNSQSSNTEVLLTKASQVENVELQNVSSKFNKQNNSQQSKRSKKINRKRKIADDDVINALQNLPATSNSDDVDGVKNVNEKDTVAFKVKLNENVPSTKFSSRKSDVRNKSVKSDSDKSKFVNPFVKLVADDILLNKSKTNNVDNNRVKNTNQNINDTVINKHPSETDKKITKKRKRSILLSEVSSEESYIKKKRDIRIKCGVCKTRVDSCKWDEHVTKDHCFIAWEDGEKFDFNNKDLFLKLKQHLNDNGKLKCVICDKIIKRVKKFLSHVEGCITYRNPFEMTDDSINEFSADKSGSSRLRSKAIICGVCKTEVNKNLWMEHVAKEHNYLSWKEGETPLDIGDEDAVIEHLQGLIAVIEKLECNSCGISCICENSFLKHIKICGKTNEEKDVAKDTSAKLKIETTVKCGVCQNEVLSNEWQNHISKEHKYLAWKEGEPELDVADSHRVYEYLYNLSKELGGLYCGKCGCRRKYVNAFLKHVESCDGEENPNCTMDSTMNESSTSINKTLDVDNLSDNPITKCGVCLKEVDKKDWEFHIKVHHSYKAWKDGETPLNLDDEEQVYNHLYAMSKKYNGLTCIKCGMTRKYVKVFLHHIESCNPQVTGDINEAILQEECYKCGVCGEKVPARDWKSHSMTKHYNIAWPEGQTPIDSKNPTAVEKCLKEYKQVHNKYVCNVCQISRVSAIGFFAHVVQCGKTEEEIDRHRDLCDICNNKYLIIYKNQHISMHRDQEYAKQRKLNLEVEKEEKKKQTITKTEILPERRLAAERARNVIEKYKKYKHNCSTCDFGADSEEDVKNHTCRKSKYNFSDSEDSVQLSSEPESDDTEVDSDLSNEEQEEIQKSVPSKKKKHADPNPAASFFPFSVQNPKAYLNESAEDFRKNHLTSNILYPQWRTCKYEVVPDELLSNYLPTVEESCQVQLHKGDWISLKKFEGVNDQKWASAAFTGGCIQCMSWTPAHLHDQNDALGHYGSVATHPGPDAPRLHAATLYTHHAMLQIWDFGDLREPPKFALGIAHDFGTVWAKDWCPSGARDMLSDSDDTKSFKRLGLLAVACSNGSAYILSVPYPSTITEGENKVYKLTPVAELRLTRGNRKRFQATAINWPSQKGHSIIIVGYSDGTTALFNLDCDSPILTDTEDGMKIYYPFQDERTHNSCVTAVSSCPGAVGSSSATGGSRAGLRGAGRGAGGGRATRSAVTATAACFMPHWPDLLLAGNDAIVYQAPNVVSWCGGGRRLGSQQAACGCARCGRVALAAPPALRLVTAHPVHKHLHKITVALLQMKPLLDKKTKQKNDELGTRLEPSTYEEAIKKYGVELQLIESFDKSYLQQSNKPRDHYPERFPLSDVSSMAFNSSPKQHKKLAVATHSGLIFVITV